MSDNFTYAPPDPKRYLQALLKLLRAKGETKLYALLKDSKCAFDASSSYSRVRWNAIYTTVYFYIPVESFDVLDLDDDSRSRLIGYCDTIMPKDVGYDVLHVELSPSLDSEDLERHSLESDLNEFSNSVGATENFYVPEDVLAKGKEMMNVYLYLYAIENYLRLFIERICLKAYGQDYFSKLTLTKNIRDTINGRKRNEEINRWISVRGDSDLFYLDFIELSALIQNNWELFKGYFPEQSWISSKLNELYGIRNLVAHNSYVGEHERNILQVTFRSIVKQLNAS
jgi:hypothetical protein